MLAVQLIGGLVLLVAGGDALVRGAVAIARHLGVSPLLIGLTLVGFGTSMPELVTSVQAALAGSPGIAVGNVVGSCIANILLILGIAALIHPLATSRQAFKRDGAAVLGAAIVCVAVAMFGALSRPVGGVLIVLLIAYLAYTIHRERRVHDASAELHEAEAATVAPGPKHIGVAVVLALGGLALTVIGADLLVTGAIALAAASGVPDAIVGLTIVAVGTSLPELVTSIMASLRRQADVAVGNVIGSNIYNVLGILGVTALVEPIAVPAEFASVDVWVMLAATIAMLAFALTGWQISRREGAFFLVAYVGYLAYLATQLPA